MAAHTGTKGRDRFTGKSQADAYDGKENYDVVSYASSTANLIINLASPSANRGDARGDTFLSIESFYLGAGNDRFVISEAPLKFNLDTITDFNVADDTIAIDNLFLPKLKDGALKVGSFWIGAQAHNGNDRIIFDNTSGKLWFDEDGKGRHAAQLIGTLDTSGLTGTLTSADFIIV